MSLWNYAALSTEQTNPNSSRLDRLTALEVVRLMNREDRRVISAVTVAAPQVARAVQLIAESLRKGGRLFFAGAGTSGRLGVLEAAECPPTFNTSPSLIQAIMAGGSSAVFRSREGSEDSQSEAARTVRKKVRKGDILVGVAASGVTPYVQEALRTAKGRKAQTILVTCNSAVSRRLADVTIVLRTGPEILSGSTRLKAGSACKMVLNMLTTASMVKLGKVYGNLMVDLQPRSRKLRERGVRLIRMLGQTNDQNARRLLKQAQGHVKLAIVMARTGLSSASSRRRLQAAGGFLKDALCD